MPKGKNWNKPDESVLIEWSKPVSGRERLDNLACLLENLEFEENDSDRFDLGNWIIKKHLNPRTEKCGTAACALGWAALHPWFQAQGMISEPWVSVGRGDFEMPNLKGKPAHKAVEGPLETACEFFGISRETAEKFFMPSQYRPDISAVSSIKPGDVAKRIRAYLKETR